MFGKWLIFSSYIPLVNIYKYSYLLLINKLLDGFETDILLPEIEPNIIVEEFIIDVNINPLINISLIEDIKKIKNDLSNIKIWYWDNNSLNNILENQVGNKDAN